MGNLVARLECIAPTGDTLGLWDDDVKALPSNVRPETSPPIGEALSLDNL